MSEHPDISYLKQDNIGKVVAAGLAELYREKPTFPVDYLAKWLLNFSNTKKNESCMREEKEKEDKLRDHHLEILETEKEDEIKRNQVVEQKNKIDLAFRDHIENYEYHEELLNSVLAEGIFVNLDLTGIYIAQYEYPIQQPDENAVDDYASHLDINRPQLLQYIGGDNKSSHQLLGQSLPNDIGVTYDLFKPPGGGDEAPVDENDDADVDAKKENWVYIPDVVVEPKVHYFQIPRLGSYLSVPIFVNSYLSENTFDDALKKTKEYKEACKKLEEDKKVMEEEFQVKIEEARQNGENFDDIQAEFDEKMKEFEPLEEPTFEAEEKKYVQCCDTLGKDKEISYEDRVYINSIAQHFARSWETKELSYIKSDVENYIAYEVEAAFEENLTRYGDQEERDLGARAKELEDLPEAVGLYRSIEIK